MIRLRAAWHRSFVPTLFSTLVLSFSTVLADSGRVIPEGVGSAPEVRAGVGGFVSASWGDGLSLSREDYDEWRVWRGLEEGDQAVEELIYVIHMAEAARKGGLDQTTMVRLAIEAGRRKLLGGELERHLAESVRISDEAVEAVAKAHPEAFQKPQKYLLRNLFKRLPAEGEEARVVRDRMEELRNQAAAGSDFKQLARLESESQTRFRDGHMGRFAAEDLPPPVADAVRSLTAGAVSQVVEYAGGLTIFYCERVDAAVRPEPAVVRERIAKNMRRIAVKEQWEGLVSRLRSESGAAAPLQDDELAALVVARHPGKRVEGLSPEQLRELQTDWALEGRLAARAVELGLDRKPSVAAALRWTPSQILAGKELTRWVDQRIKEPSEAEVREYFEAHRGSYRELPQFLLAAIRFGDSTHAVAQEAAKILGQIDGGELSFAEAARRYSTGPSAAADGLLGWKSLAQLNDWDLLVSKAARQLSPGQNSGLLSVKSGIWLIELRERREAASMEFEQVAPRVQQELRTRAIKALEEEARREILGGLSVTIHRSTDSATPKI